MNVEDLHKRLKELYLPPEGQFTLVDVPKIDYLVVDGEGDPQGEAYARAMKWLFSVVHLIKPLVKARMGKNFVEPPLEGLYWAENEKDFASRNVDRYLWRVMIVFIEKWITQADLANAIAEAEKKLGPAPTTLRMKSLHEGKSVQIMHVGDYDGIGNVCDKLYKKFLPENNLQPNGHYHEIYLNDPNRTAPKKRKTVIRQPVK